MQGIYLHNYGNVAPKPEKGLQLLCKCPEFEFMEQFIARDAVIWIVPAEDPSTVEFFYVHSGKIQLDLDEGPKTLSAGEFFFVQGLTHEVILKSHQDSKILYLSNRPMFEESQTFESYLNELLDEINQKDNYTHQHSHNVMHYSLMIFDHMYEGNKQEALYNDLAIASLFHDAGKCNVPDEILKKKGRLDAEEMQYIFRHPIDSARILRQYYGERVAEIAGNHHERMDGSGYPYGLKSHEISPEAKIMAVADAFDAMTSNRGYNRVKTALEAAEELVSMPAKFDPVSSKVLWDLVQSGKIIIAASPTE